MYQMLQRIRKCRIVKRKNNTDTVTGQRKKLKVFQVTAAHTRAHNI